MRTIDSSVSAGDHGRRALLCRQDAPRRQEAAYPLGMADRGALGGRDARGGWSGALSLPRVLSLRSDGTLGMAPSAGTEGSSWEAPSLTHGVAGDAVSHAG